MANQMVYYRFSNRSNRHANVYWLSHRTKRKLYSSLKPGDFVDVNTYKGHCWIFEDMKTGDALFADGKCIFTPTNWRQYVLMNFMARARIPRWTIAIKQPLQTLKGLCFHAIRDTNISLEDAEKLDLPRTLKDELLHIVRKRNCAVLHKSACKNCPYDVHKAHYLHSCNVGACLPLLKANSTGRLVRLPHGRVTCIPGASSQS